MNLTFILTVLVFYLLQSTHCLGSEIKVYEFTKNSNLSYPGKQLVGHVFEEFSTKRQVLHCAYECLRARRCQSFNYGRTDRVCQLNDATHEDFTDSLVDEQPGRQREYHLRDAFSIEEEALGPCANDPCQHGGRCLDTMTAKNERTYYCICEEGWEGNNCEFEKHRLDWSQWKDWGPCSVTCATGWTTRRRSCMDTVTGEEMSSDMCFGRDVEYQSCTLLACPQWKPWEEWGPCSTENTCGSGIKVRYRECSNGGTAGVDRFCLGFTNDTAPCRGIDCRGRIRLLDGPLYGEGRVEIYNDLVAEWSPVCADPAWNLSAANIACKQIGFLGADTAIDDGRYGGDPSVSETMTSLDCSGEEKTIQACPRSQPEQCGVLAGVQCQVRGGWSLWTSWGECSVTCENGTRTRTRECNHPPPNHNGRQCPDVGVQYKDCTLPMCPRNGTWGGWGSWSACDVTCGEGTRERLRQCDSDVMPCYGTNQTFDICVMTPCAVDGVWRPWTDWSECDVTCANGTRYRTRECIGPFYGGAECPGAADDAEDCFPRMCEVDGVWDEWALWTECSATCGYGNRNRSRTCHGPFYGGKECPGSPDEIEVCNAFSCPVDGTWKLWAEWGECSVTCGGGHRNRSRDCNSAQFNGLDCQGPSDQSQPCNEHFCPIDGVFTEWNQWSECSVTCANGTRYRERECIGPFHGGQNCTDQYEEIEICVTKSCPVDGVWGDWAVWDTCNVTCGGGTRFRLRQCIGPHFNGRECEGPNVDIESCNEHECPIDGVWDYWSSWTTCSVTCGGGTQNRNRTCIGPFHLGADCDGPHNETQDCNTHDCPVDGDWTIWTDWTACNVSCGGGTTWRTRECIEPLHGGADCSGPALESEDCNTHNCPIDGEWQIWSNWTECSLTCGNGSQSRERTCDGPFYGGQACEGDWTQTRLCNTFHCPIDGEWRPWSEWGECSVTCARGTKIRTRTCDGPFYEGQNCTGPASESAECIPGSCPVDGLWLPWTPWTDCSTTCENGTRTRNRTCDGPFFGGLDCHGDERVVEDCFLRFCPVDGIWASWSDWTECPVTCAGGIQNRSRDCLGTKYGGAYCDGEAEESRDCNTIPCPVDGMWSLWSGWSVCTLTCGGGTSDRYRFCSFGKHGGANCTGNGTETRDCNSHECPIDGVWETWSNWTACTHSCGTGERYRARNCTGPFFGGHNCTGDWDEMENCNTHECPVDGQWSPWMVWGMCSASCGGGKTVRVRTCHGEANGGKACEGSSQETSDCNMHACPVDGVWETWTPWESCNTTCGGGTRLRFRNCTGPFFGGAECPGSNVSHEACNTHECPIDGVWDSWATWEACSVTCGGGNQSRERNCTGPFFGGADCLGDTTDTRACNPHECPIDGVLTEWSPFYSCNVSCGGGIQWRNRTCFGPFYGGANCTDPLEESRDCNTHPCPIDGVWLTWALWTECTVTCGKGLQTRNRSCEGPFHGGLECEGAEWENRTCNDFHCPVDGLWRTWSAWDPCSVSCGGSVHWRRRTCDGPFYGGSNCTGAWEESQDCNTHPCPVDGVFEEWSSWYECSLTCGTGVQWRNRTCTGPFHGGQDCEGPREDSQQCNTFECPVDGTWTEWGSWSQCDASCGGGSQLRTRTCAGAAHGGADCGGAFSNMQFCNEHECPVDGVWSSWQEWGECSVTCGKGITKRMRECNGPFFGGKECSGTRVEQANCSARDICPVDGVWDQWQGWSQCNTTCGGGFVIRFRECIGPFYEGAPCDGPSNETDICATAPCPIPGDWGEWTPWSLCSATCDGGQRNRSRVCDMDSYGNLTIDCLGEPDEVGSCHTYSCQPAAIHCADWADKGLSQSCWADVDPDGDEGPLAPVLVECDFDSEPGKALTLLHHDQENVTNVQGYEGAGSYRVDLEYDPGWEETLTIIDESAECKQYMRWDCLAAIIHNPFKTNSLTTFWRNRTFHITNYFGGATPDSGNCACGETHTCFNASLPCNCDSNNETVWLFDDGFVTNKGELPITSFSAGDTGGSHEDGYKYIGPVTCAGMA